MSVCKKTNGFRSSLIKTLCSSFERLGGGIAIFGFAVSAIFLFLGRISVLTPVAVSVKFHSRFPIIGKNFWICYSMQFGVFPVSRRTLAPQ